MKGGLIMGAIAGFISGLFGFLLGPISISLGIFEMPSIPMDRFVTIMMILSIIMGAVLGIIYSMFYSSIPGKGAMKGLYYGLIIFVISIATDWAYIALCLGMTLFAIGNAFILFFSLVVYGLVLGGFYKK